jgi:hypothetical protein
MSLQFDGEFRRHNFFSPQPFVSLGFETGKFAYDVAPVNLRFLV